MQEGVYSASQFQSEDLHIVARFHLELSRFHEYGCNVVYRLKLNVDGDNVSSVKFGIVGKTIFNLEY